MKICKTCNQEKPFELFGVLKRPNGRQYYRSDCKQCCVERLKEWKKTPDGQENHKDHVRKYMAERKLLADAALEAIKAGLIKDPRL